MKFTSISRKGGRENNTDSVGKASAGGIYCFVVADGLDEPNDNNVVSSTAVDAVLDAFGANPVISSEARYSDMLCAQNAVMERRSRSSSFSPTATTLVVLVTDGKEAVWGHIGNSRLYRFEKSIIQEITDDHSVAFAAFIGGKCMYNDIRTSPDKSRLLRALGTENNFTPQISEKFLCSKKTAFLLCTDGFWEYVHEDIM